MTDSRAQPDELAPGGRRRRRALDLVVFAVFLVLSLGATEVILRSLGHTPLGNLPYPDVPLMHEPDPELGWQNKPGEYVFGDEQSIRMTFWPGGFRATASERHPRPRPILILGGSLAQGWAVSDAETTAWTLQEAFPATEVLNLGTGGYGTYQSLLALERFLEESSTNPSLVIYGFNALHETRNVASTWWLQMLSSLSQLGAVYVPYATLDPQGGLERHPPLGYPDWELRRRLATVALLEEAYVDLHRGRRHIADARKISEKLMIEMARVARASGADFMVAALSNWGPRSKDAYLRFLQREGVAVVDCAHPLHGTEELTVPDYAHPNARANAHWARCIVDAIERRGRQERGPAS